jgi:hypothetical protein
MPIPIGSQPQPFLPLQHSRIFRRGYEVYKKQFPQFNSAFSKQKFCLTGKRPSTWTKRNFPH